MLFPNPVNGQLHVINPVEGVWKLDLNSIHGQQVIHHTRKGADEAHIDVSQLPKGVYMLGITDNNGRKTRFNWAQVYNQLCIYFENRIL